MAKRFAGFKPETFEKKILPALGYDGPTDMKSINLFLAASPAAAVKMGRYTMAARRMVEGEPVKAFGGKDIFGRPMTEDKPKVVPVNKNVPLTQQPLSMPQPTTPANPTNGATNGIVVDSTKKDSAGSKMTGKITKDPTKVATKAAVVSSDGGAAAKIATNTGQAGTVTQAGTTAAGPAGSVAQPSQLTAQQVTAAGAAPAVTTALQQTQAAQGQVSPEAQVQAAQMDPTQAASLGLQAAQTTAGMVAPVAQLQATPDQLISGSAVDMDKAEDVLQKSEAATVRDELSGLMKDFEGGATPSWAAGAMRAATAQMAARGLGSSSMAGMATVQAAMESALPIAQMDASNKQQMAMAKAEQRAKFLGMAFDQTF